MSGFRRTESKYAGPHGDIDQAGNRGPLAGDRWMDAGGQRHPAAVHASRVFRTRSLFVTRLAFDAEAADHHPDILVNYKRVTLTVQHAQRGRAHGKGLRRGARGLLAGGTTDPWVITRPGRGGGSVGGAEKQLQRAGSGGDDGPDRTPAPVVGHAPAVRVARGAAPDRARRLYRASLHAGRSARASRARRAAAAGPLRRPTAHAPRNAARHSSASGCSKQSAAPAR